MNAILITKSTPKIDQISITYILLRTLFWVYTEANNKNKNQHKIKYF